VLVGVSCGSVWRTRDSGRTWVQGGPGMRAEFMPPERQFDPNIQDPHILVQCRAKPDALWVQHQNGIFKSIDAAESWTEVMDVQPSAFGFAVAVHPSNPGVAMWISDNGGDGWETVSTNLPPIYAVRFEKKH
jgi:hypothetical protein